MTRLCHHTVIPAQAGSQIGSGARFSYYMEVAKW